MEGSGFQDTGCQVWRYGDRVNGATGWPGDNRSFLLVVCMISYLELRNMLKKMSWPVFSLMLSACVTINIYFPAAAAEEAARTIVRDVLSAPGEEKVKTRGRARVPPAGMINLHWNQPPLGWCLRAGCWNLAWPKYTRLKRISISTRQRSANCVLR